MRLPIGPLIDQHMQAPQMKSVNGIGLLNLIRERGPVSRADLAKMSKLSKPTVSSQIEGLIRQGLVIEIGPGQSGIQGGKKPTLIRFNSDSGLLTAVEIDSEQIRIAVTDLEGVILSQTSLPTEPAKGAGAVLAKVRSGITKLLRGFRDHRGQIRLISIACPGRVDARRGIVLDAGNVFQWNNVPIREDLEAAFGIPVFADNNVNMAALGEMAHGLARGEENFVLIRLDTGLGSATVMDGRLLHGTHWAAGEIAHALLDLTQAGADWNARGYLETVVGKDCVAARVRQAALNSGGTLAALCGQKGEWEGLFEAAKQGDSGARAIVDDIVLHLGIAIANYITVQDPALVLVEGEIFGFIFEEVRQVAANAIPWPARICRSDLEHDAVLLGTVVSARSHAYERITHILKGDSERAEVQV